MPKHYSLKAEPVPYDADPTIRTALRNTLRWLWSQAVWNVRRALRLRRR